MLAGLNGGDTPLRVWCSCYWGSGPSGWVACEWGGQKVTLTSHPASLHGPLTDPHPSSFLVIWESVLTFCVRQQSTPRML